MSFLLDKITDAVFIFLGVYFAFHFDQYQEDRGLKKELGFNLSEIMKTLPEDDPLKVVAPFGIETTKEESGGCSYSVDPDFETVVTGGDFLRIIKDRGLVRFIEDKDLISILTVYYIDVIPDFKEKRHQFYKGYQDFVVGNLHASGKSSCISKAQLEKWKTKLGQLYVKAKIQDGAALKVGHYLRNELESLGYVASEKKSYRLHYYFQTAESPEDFKLIEERRKRRKVKTIGELPTPGVVSPDKKGVTGKE